MGRRGLEPSHPLRVIDPRLVCRGKPSATYGRSDAPSLHPSAWVVSREKPTLIEEMAP